MRTRFLKQLLLLAMPCLLLTAHAADVPAVLPHPDNTPPAADKKVKVYILAGQSNMVGFGRYSGAKPVYPSIFLSADPSIKPGRMPIGPSALLPMSLYVTPDADAEKGARVSVYPGAYNPEADYRAMQPLKTVTVNLGTTSAQLPKTEGEQTLVARAFLDVPVSGTFEIHPGFEDSTHAIVTVGDKEVYRKEVGKEAVLTQVELEQDERVPLTITYFKTGSAAFWLEQVGLKGKGDLKDILAKGMFSWFADEKGEWTTRNDVIYWDVRTNKNELGDGGFLSTTSNGKHIGAEVPFGYVMGTYHDEPVLLIESSMGNRALSFDFRPPSSGREDPDNKFEGYEYRHMIEGVHKTLENIDKVVPGYDGQGYEIVGFVWWQGHKDRGKSKEEYEKHLVNLIQDIRKEFNVPDMRAVVASVGFDGKRMIPEYVEILKAQMAVGDPEQHPEFAGKVASIDTRPFWRSQGESPTGTGYHYNHNAETYALVGDSLGRAMVRLLGGTAEAIKRPKRKEMPDVVETIYAPEVTSKLNKTGTNYPADYYKPMAAALRPIILEKMIPAFVAQAFSKDSRRLGGFEMKYPVLGTKPPRVPLDIQGQLDKLAMYYDIAGVDEYNWQPFAPNMKSATWHYFTFDPPEKQDLKKSDRYREITLPKGMQNWYAADFNATEADWKQGQAPFGQFDGKLMARRNRCNGPRCECSTTPKTLWDKEVLLMRQTFDVPPLKDGHVYRLILGGAGCDRSGEGFAIYVNGKLLKQEDGGFFRHPGIRGAYIYKDMLPEFKGGKVTIAIINFLRYTHFKNGDKYWGPMEAYQGKTVPANGHVNVWMEEMKLSPMTLQAASTIEDKDL